ncbi:hypothetical protein Tco_0722384 [Tanacetum coccineum]
MSTEKSQPSIASSPAAAPVVESCRKKKSEDATFLQDVKDHIDEFVNASMAEHKTCFQKTISKMFSMSKRWGKDDLNFNYKVWDVECGGIGIRRDALVLVVRSRTLG